MLLHLVGLLFNVSFFCYERYTTLSDYMVLHPKVRILQIVYVLLILTFQMCGCKSGN